MTKPFFRILFIASKQDKTFKDMCPKTPCLSLLAYFPKIINNSIITLPICLKLVMVLSTREACVEKNQQFCTMCISKAAIIKMAK